MLVQKRWSTNVTIIRKSRHSPQILWRERQKKDLILEDCTDVWIWQSSGLWHLINQESQKNYKSDAKAEERQGESTDYSTYKYLNFLKNEKWKKEIIYNKGMLYVLMCQRPLHSSRIRERCWTIQGMPSTVLSVFTSCNSHNPQYLFYNSEADSQEG